MKEKIIRDHKTCYGTIRKEEYEDHKAIPRSLYIMTAVINKMLLK